MRLPSLFREGFLIREQTFKTIEDFNPGDFDAIISLCGRGVNLPEGWVPREVFEDRTIETPDGKSLETFQRVRDGIKKLVSGLVAKLIE